MKPTSICIATTLAILWTGSIALAAKDATDQKPVARLKQPPAEEETTKILTPQQRRLESLQKSYEMDTVPWRDVLKIAEQEKATKTIAAIKKILKTKEDAYKRDMARLERLSVSGEKAPNAKTVTTDPNKDAAKIAEKQRSPK